MAESSIWNVLTQTVSSHPALPANLKFWTWDARLSYATGNYIEINGTKTALDLHYVDPLADVFNDIKKRYHRNLPDIEFGMVEYLSDFFPRHDADLIIIQNALDHSAMPIKGIQEAFSTLKTGGILYLNHHPNEAETEQYKGFHQYNIDEENGKLVIWNKIGKVYHSRFTWCTRRHNRNPPRKRTYIAIIKKSIPKLPSEEYPFQVMTACKYATHSWKWPVN